MAETIQTDIAIVGGGLVGMAMALTMARAHAQSGLSVCLLDAGDPAARANIEADGRASAITATAVNMLKALQVWPRLADHAQPMREIKVTDSQTSARGRPVFLHFDEAVSRAASAHMIENRFIYDALWQAIGETGTVTLHTGHSIETADWGEAAARLVLDDGRNVSAALVIGADGRASPLRASAGIETVGWSYGQHGIVTSVAHEKPHNGIAEEHFLPAGPFAILPLPGNRSSLVWTEREEFARDLVGGDDATFQAELERRFGERLGRIAIDGPRMSYPLGMQLSKAFIAPRLALIGDAAHVVHPIAGLGFNLGLRDVAVLADTVANEARLGLDIGSTAGLSRYQAARRFDTLTTALTSDGLNRLFSNDNAALRMVRDFGLALVDRAGPLKGFFMDQAAGRNTPLPAIMRGDGV